jgi:hypothetical protein
VLAARGKAILGNLVDVLGADVTQLVANALAPPTSAGEIQVMRKWSDEWFWISYKLPLSLNLWSMFEQGGY